MEKKTDRRTLYTKQVITDAFVDLLSAKPLEKITITEICKNAQISRSTFYLHYQSENDILNEFADNLLKTLEIGTNEIMNSSNLRETQKRIYNELATSKVYVAIIKNNSSYLNLKFQNAGKDALLYHFRHNHSMSKQEAELCATFISAGFYAMWSHWIIDGIEHFDEELDTMNKYFLKNVLEPK